MCDPGLLLQILILCLELLNKSTKSTNQRIGKAYSEKNEFNFRDDMTNSLSSSEDSFHVSIQIDHEKISRQNQPPRNNWYLLHDLMSSTNETQDKDYYMRFPHVSPNKRVESAGQKFRNGRFTIRKLALPKNTHEMRFDENIKDNTSDKFQTGDLIFEKQERKKHF
jgi:hypothetical protein